MASRNLRNWGRCRHSEPRHGGDQDRPVAPDVDPVGQPSRSAAEDCSGLLPGRLDIDVQGLLQVHEVARRGCGPAGRGLGQAAHPKYTTTPTTTMRPARRPRQRSSAQRHDLEDMHAEPPRRPRALASHHPSWRRSGARTGGERPRGPGLRSGLLRRGRDRVLRAVRRRAARVTSRLTPPSASAGSHATAALTAHRRQRGVPGDAERHQSDDERPVARAGAVGSRHGARPPGWHRRRRAPRAATDRAPWRRRCP